MPSTPRAEPQAVVNGSRWQFDGLIAAVARQFVDFGIHAGAPPP